MTAPDTPPATAAGAAEPVLAAHGAALAGLLSVRAALLAATAAQGTTPNGAALGALSAAVRVLRAETVRRVRDLSALRPDLTETRLADLSGLRRSEIARLPDR